MNDPYELERARLRIAGFHDAAARDRLLAAARPAGPGLRARVGLAALAPLASIHRRLHELDASSPRARAGAR